MLDNLSGKFNKVLKYLKGEAKITEDNIKVAMREIKLSLLEADVNYKVVKQFTTNVKEKAMGTEVQESLNPYQHMVKIVQAELEEMLGSEDKDLKTPPIKPAIIMLVGLQGTGKTTTAGKLAYYLKEQGKTSLLCSLDLKRLAAGEQLETIAKEVGAHYFNRDSNDLKKVSKALIKTSQEYGYDYIIADTAGRLHIDDELMDELSRVKKYLDPTEIIFVADSLTGQDAVNSAQSFSERIGIDSVILTKLDADARGGAALSIVSVTGKPIKFIGVGEKNSDFQKFYPDRLASQILGMGDVLTLIEKAEKDLDEKKAEEMTRRLLRNEFTLDDLLSQLGQIQRLGSMSDILGMIPNIGINQQMAMADGSINDKKIKHMAAIIQSMTLRERENPKIINGKRRYRIAKGSGRPVQEVNQLLRHYNEMKKYMKKPFFKKMLKKFDFLSKMM
ncbi:MAG: signal recognition particle protein [Candidatus Aminicenantes bacterium]|nr:signal recognition particle protein [Candidatus Aminicenantes bacterium]NIM84949.1 signal recognition particle protein [Candidatus Aminicenantes bacterium]NIN24463.1 signal recognition particle protein [Candidatus Aminicenantes bacterium]NIN48227.1 signal recognition particle protein [Candidatus Aminicenantes bacterium]NIN91130.1 signal recognition particle protein [Candidatus Aminicenantes bacterium]